MSRTIRENLLGLVEPLQGAPVSGYWRPIHAALDFATDEVINVGVLFESKKARYFKLLENPKPLGRVFGPAAEDEARFLLALIKSCLERGVNSFPAHNVSLGKPKFAAGGSPDEIISRLYKSVVTLAKGPATKKRTCNYLPVNNTWVRARTLDKVRCELGLFAESLVPAEEVYCIEVENREVALDLPIRGDDCVGSVISSGFFQKETIELNYLRATTDILTGRAIREANRSTLFVFYPDDKAFWPSEEKRKQAGNVIDFYEWKLKKQKLSMLVTGDERVLTNGILNLAGK